MMRFALAAAVLALAAAVLALAAAAHPAPHGAAARNAKHKSAVPTVVVRAQIVGGNAQTAHAYAATAASQYVTDFARLLVVRVPGWPADGGSKRVRFHCATKGCTFAAAEQPNDSKDIDRVDPATYDAHVTKGRASARISIEADHPTASYTVIASPRAGKGERAIAATFTLTTR